MSESSFLTQLMARRVPQILGLYVAGTWMTIEIGDWMSEQLQWPAHTTLVVFAFLASLLPSVAVVAWNHGAPGPDRWLKLEKGLIPINLLAAAVVAWLVATGPENLSRPQSDAASGVAEIALKTTEGSDIVQRTIVDETGTEQVFRVAKRGSDRRVYGFFWQSSGNLEDWRGYSVPWLLAQDLNRDPRISFRLPYELDIKEDFQRAGFPRAVGEPLALDLSIAKDGSAQWLVVGEVQPGTEGRFRLACRLVAVATGEQEAEFSAEGDDFLALAEQISDQLAEAIIGDDERESAGFADLALSESTTSNPDALRALIEGLNAWWFDNDYDRGLTLLDQAVALDPAFAPAHDWRHMFLRLKGDLSEATEALRNALNYDYKLDSQTRFKLKANQYALTGQTDRAIRVLEMWSEVHPNSFDAFRLLARNYMLVGRIDEAREKLQQASALNPNAAEIYRSLANIERMSGEPMKAAELLERYLEDEPDDADAILALASGLLQAGQFERARSVYEEATMMAARDFESGSGIANAYLREGRFDEVQRQLDQLAASHPDPSQQLQISLIRIQVLAAEGRFQEALDLVEALDAAASQVLPPIQRVFVMGGFRATFNAGLGRFDQALEEVEALRPQVQGPLEILLELNRMVVFILAKNLEGLKESLDRMDERSGQVSVPLTGPYRLIGQAQVALLEGRADEAFGQFEAATAAVRRTPLALDMELMDTLVVWTARAESRAGRWQDAQTRLEEHLVLSPADASAKLELAELLQERNQPDRARQLLDQVLAQWEKADPDYLELQRAQRLNEVAGRP